MPRSCASFQRGTQESGIRAPAFCKLLLLTGKRLIGDMGCERPLWGGEIEALAELRGECLHYNRWEIRLAPTSPLSLAACSSILSHNCKDLNALGGWNFQVTCFILFFTTIQKTEVLHTDQASRSHICSAASTGAAWGRALLSSRVPEAGQ